MKENPKSEGLSYEISMMEGDAHAARAKGDPRHSVYCKKRASELRAKRRKTKR